VRASYARVSVTCAVHVSMVLLPNNPLLGMEMLSGVVVESFDEAHDIIKDGYDVRTIADAHVCSTLTIARAQCRAAARGAGATLTEQQFEARWAMLRCDLVCVCARA
jgi:hypothetical protein